MGERYKALVDYIEKLQDVRMAVSVLSWDQQTQMPRGGNSARARQLATLSRISHEMMTSDEMRRLLEDSAKEVADEEYGSNPTSTVRVLQQDFEEATKLPADFVAKWAQETTLADEVWVKARAESDFSIFQPTLEKLMDMAREMADYYGYDENPYDALLGQYERGITTAEVKQIFDDHKPALVELIAQISENADAVDNSVVRQDFPADPQREFALKMIEAIGFDFNRGYQAVSVHPFCTHFSSNDVRITTRFEEDFFNPAFFGMLHEAGHGVYEQGISQSLEGTPMASGTSLAVHESQSRMIENLVGRSKEFWSWALPQAKEVFPNQFGDVDLDTFYKAINKVSPSFIRVEADEVTYNMHIILRFELEIELISGQLEVADVPEAWNSRFQDYFGITPSNDAQGCLQDVHWSAGLQGYFATYALGNLLSVQYYNQALKAHPNIPNEFAQGKFDTLLTWLNENIHQHGRKFTSAELTKRVTGESIQSRDYIAYLQSKFGDIYGLN